MTKEYKLLIELFNSLPGVKVSQYLLDKPFDRVKAEYGKIYFFLHIDQNEQEGLFFLARCIDNRYWHYGRHWELSVEISDTIHDNGDRPLIYVLSVNIDNKPESIFTLECDSLIDNMYYHFNHEAFVKQFNINKDKYQNLTQSKESWYKQEDRNEKINQLGI